MKFPRIYADDCDDVSGKGHVTRSISDIRLAFVNRADA
jgi:hypothetical protein